MLMNLPNPSHRVINHEKLRNRCFDGTVDKGKNLELARAYWENDAKADEKHHPVVEVLVDGEIEVIDIIKDI